MNEAVITEAEATAAAERAALTREGVALPVRLRLGVAGKLETLVGERSHDRTLSFQEWELIRTAAKMLRDPDGVGR